MEWEKLLSLKRHGDNFKRKRIDQDETRLGFDVDYDRIIFSSEFRSLQDKTQVVPFSQGDFVHTRLTHSLETSVVGRSLGRRVGVEILKKYPHLKNDLGYHANDFGAIVASASLAHDIGNPPFGHSGEKSIGQYFMSGPGKKFDEILKETLAHEQEAIRVYYELLELVQDNSVYLEEYARSMIGQEELHVLEVEKMLKNN